MNHITEPIYVDQHFERGFPLPPQAMCCCPCMMLCVPKIRGILKGSQPLPADEQKALLEQMAGNWKIQPLDGGKGTFQYEDAMVRDNYYVLTGGQRNRGHGKDRHAVANAPMKEQFHFYRGPNGELYIDNIGSMITKLDFANGEIEMNNGIGFVLLWQRGWKRDGLPPPQQQQMAAPAAVATPVVAATVVGAEAAAAPTQQA